MDEIPDMINMAGGGDMMKHIHQIKDKLAARKTTQLNNAVNSLNALNTTSMLSNHTEQILNQKNNGFYSKLYSSIIELGNEFWLSIIATVIIIIIKHILYDEEDTDVNITNVSTVVEGNASYDTELSKQRKLLYYIKNKFKWAEFTSNTSNAIVSVMINGLLIRTLAKWGYTFDRPLFIIVIVIAGYSGALRHIADFIVEWITDNKSKSTNNSS